MARTAQQAETAFDLIQGAKVLCVTQSLPGVSSPQQKA